jgi:hypothetical protein
MLGGLATLTIRLLTQYSFLCGVSLHTLSWLSYNEVTIGTAIEAIHKDATGIYSSMAMLLGPTSDLA